MNYSGYYAIVEVKHEKFQKFVTVPAEYINYDKDRKAWVRYMQPPISAADNILLQNHIKNRTIPPPSDWTPFLCTVTAYMKSYHQAIEYCNNFAPQKEKPQNYHTDEESDTHARLLIDKIITSQTKQLKNMGKDIRSHIFGKDITSSFVRKSRHEELTTEDLQEWTEQCITNIDKNHMLIEKAVEGLRSRIIQLKSVKMNDYVMYDQFVDMYGQFQFPFECNKDFQLFDMELRSDRNNLKTNLKKCLKISIDRRKTISYNVKSILKKFFKASVLNLYTSQRKRGSKELFSQTKFYKCLYDCIHFAYRGTKKETVSEKKVLSSIGAVFNLAKGWEVPRKRKHPDDDGVLESEEFNQFSHSSEEAAPLM